MPYEASVGPAVQPSVDVPLAYTPQALGAGVAQGVQQLGDVATDIHLREIDHANRVNVLDADNQTQAFLQAKVYDARTGILNQPLRKEAPAAADQTLSDYDQSTAKVMDGLTNEAQKAHYRQMAGERRMQLQDHLGKWEHEQTELHADEVAKGSIANATTMAVQNADDPLTVADNIALQREVILHRGQDKNLAPELIEAQQRDVASATHLAVIEQLVSSGQDQTAADWFDQNKKDLTAQDLTQATRLVHAGSLAGESQRIADEFLFDKDGKVRSRAEVLSLIEKDRRLAANTKLRDEVDTRTQHALSEHAQAKTEQEGATVNQAWGILNDPANRQGPANPQYVALKATLPMERQEQLDRAERREIPEFSKDVADLQRLVGTPAFEHVDLTQYVGRVRDAQLNHFQEVQVEQRNKGAKSPKVVEAVTQERIVSNGIADLRLDGDKPENSDEAMAYRRKFDLAKDAALNANGGKPLTEDDLSGIAKRLAADYVVTSPRAAWSPLRLFGSTTFQDDKGQLYKQSPDTILRNVPIPGTVRLSTGEGMTAAGVDDWVKVLANPKSPSFQAAQVQLRKMRAGIADDGSVDPAIAARYQVIQEAYAATLAPATKP